ncbi:EamA family transporter [Nocardioides sp. T2.26MG-1]|uniref:EamA family transporter n=1 Tax=Nocardioides sp. T2.26MG-1 TaxID=3041166 RepID=UPI00247757CF|nr:EamA family transporter [Nocardioides sp. T2.26MG-1]CAI9412705.1 hypothetical protein HIDPHFAB_01839 [Nocardioides sp. T2.26MG-1]
MHRPSQTLGLGVAATLGLGAPFWLIAVAQQAMPTATMAAVRVTSAVAALGLASAVLSRRNRGGAAAEIAGLLRRHPLAVATVTLGAAVLPNLLIGAGERHVPTGTTAVILAMTPVWIALATSIRPAERLRAPQVVALPVALAGVALICATAVPASALHWSLLPLAASGCYAVAAIVVRAQLSGVSPLALSTAEMGLASLALLPLAALAGGDLHWKPAAWAAVAAVGVGCSGLGWLANTALIQQVGAARSSIVSYASVIVSVALGAAFLDEPITARVCVGILVIVTAVAVFLAPPGILTRTTNHPSRKERLVLELCILGFLAEEPLHAYELRRRITALTGHVRPVSDGALSPATKRLEARGLVTRTTAPGDGGPARVVLHLTDEGRSELLRRLVEADHVDVSDRNRWFAVLAFLHHVPEVGRQRAVLERRLAFLEDPARGFFIAGGDQDSLFREGMTTMAKATWQAEHAWLRRSLASLGA